MPRLNARHAAPGLLLLALGACASQPTPEPAPMPDAAPATMPATTGAGAMRADSNMFPRPTLGPAPTLTLPPSTVRELPNGMRLVVVEQHELPIVDFVLQVETGGEADPAKHEGVATLTASLLTEGTRSRTSLQIADQEAFLGVEVSAGAGWDASRVTLHAPTAQLDSALALFADVVLRPSFPAREFTRIKQERLTDLLQLRDRAPAIADRAYAGIVYGASHPYGRPLSGTEASTRLTTRADVESFYSTNYRPNNATLIVVGDVTADDVERRVRALFAGWTKGTAKPAAIAATPAPAATRVYLVDKPGAVQSSIRIGNVGVARSTEDYFPLLVLNTILGGSFTSRLNNNLRETKGYTYGARSRFDMRRAAGPFTASAEVTGTKTDSSLIEFFKELRAIRDTVPAGELDKAKRFLQLQLPGAFETTGGIASQLAPLVLYDLPLEFYGSYVGAIERVTQADVQRVARQYVDPARVRVVVVGDRKSIEAGVRALELGPIELRDVTGKVVQ